MSSPIETPGSASVPGSVLVYVSVDLVGDGLIKLPFLRTLRNAFPEALITWLAGKGRSVYAHGLAPPISLFGPTPPERFAPLAPTPASCGPWITQVKMAATPWTLFPSPPSGRRLMTCSGKSPKRKLTRRLKTWESPCCGPTGRGA